MLHGIAMANIDMLLECGTQDLSTAYRYDKPDLIQTIALNKVIIASLAHLTDFKQGLCVLGVGDVLKKHAYCSISFSCFG